MKKYDITYFEILCIIIEIPEVKIRKTLKIMTL